MLVAWRFEKSGSVGVFSVSEVGVILLSRLIGICAGAVVVSEGDFFCFFVFCVLEKTRSITVSCSVLEVPPASCSMFVLFAQYI